MGQVSLTVQAINVKWSGDETAAAAAMDAFGKMLASFTSVPAPIAITAAAPLSLPDPIAPDQSTKRLGRPRKAARTASVDQEEPPAAERPPTMADKIQGFIEARGPLSTSRLAQLLACGENSVRICMGKSKGRFVVDDDDNWIVAGGR